MHFDHVIIRSNNIEFQITSPHGMKAFRVYYDLHPLRIITFVKGRNGDVNPSSLSLPECIELVERTEELLRQTHANENDPG